MTTTRTLRMKFTTASGKDASVNVAHCRENLTGELVGAAMDAVIEAKVFAADFSGKVGADIIERSVRNIF